MPRPGVLLGGGSNLPAGLRADMNATGTSHMVAVSGQNVTIVAIVVLAALTWLVGRRSAAWAAIGAVALYAALVGFDASVVRGAIMGALWIAAIIVGRQSSAVVSLGIAAALMTAWHPQVIHEIGFQLSFASFLGLAPIGGPLLLLSTHQLSRWPSVSAFPGAQSAAMLATMTLASLAFTAPITLLNFDRMSIVAPLANLFAVPAFVAVMATSALVAILGLASPQAADVAALIAWPPAAYMFATVRLFASLPVASVHLSGVETWHVIPYYASLGAFTLWLAKVAPKSGDPLEAPTAVQPSVRRLAPALSAALVMAAAAALVWLAAFSTTTVA